MKLLMRPTVPSVRDSVMAEMKRRITTRDADGVYAKQHEPQARKKIGQPLAPDAQEETAELRYVGTPPLANEELENRREIRKAGARSIMPQSRMSGD